MKRKEILSEIQYIVDQIINKYQPLKIILFGSAGRGEYDEVDDLDFLIVKQDVPFKKAIGWLGGPLSRWAIQDWKSIAKRGTYPSCSLLVLGGMTAAFRDGERRIPA